MIFYSAYNLPCTYSNRLYKDAKLRPAYPYYSVYCNVFTIPVYKSLTFSYNILFMLSGGGTLNYFGAKGFIEQELEGIFLQSYCAYV